MNGYQMYSFLMFLYVLYACDCEYGYVEWTGKDLDVKISDYYADIPDKHVAKANYRNAINETGWAYLEIHTSAEYSDEQQAFAAGFIEGFLTRDLIWMHWQNMLKGYCYGKIDLCGLIEDFVTANEEYMAYMTTEFAKEPYWHQVKLYNIQIEGLALGYNRATPTSSECLTIRDMIKMVIEPNLYKLFIKMGEDTDSWHTISTSSGANGFKHYFWINMLGDLDELAFALSMPKGGPDSLLFGDHCTGLVKLLPDFKELYTSHVTWNSYQSMLRIQKMYVLNLRIRPGSDAIIPGHKMALSSYPAFIQSTDDFYIISSGLVTAETTIGNTNRTFYRDVSPNGQIMEYERAMIANRLARTGEEWVHIFRKHNSGTYNNQWYIVDYNKFRAKKGQYRGSVDPGLLWVIEQLPGYTEAADLTKLLLKSSYFPSYNIPYFPTVFNLSGGNERVRAFGDWFGYHTNPRAKILEDKQAGIRNLRDMYRVMRYNDYKHDPRARCGECTPPYSACNAVAARNDLNPANGTYPFRALGHRSHGAIDAKITSSRLRPAYYFVAVSSPTHNISRGIPPFQWSKFDLGEQISHKGHPDTWMFPPVIHRWEWV